MEEFYMTPIQSELFEALSHGTSLTRNDLVKKLDRARTTIYDNLEKLEIKKLIQRFGKQTGTRGRPLIFWFIPKHLLHDTFKKIGENNEKS